MEKNNIIKALEQLDKKDISSLILFTIFKLKDQPQYTTLSELIYLLDEKSFSNLLNYFGGKTIKIPTVQEFNDLLSALLVLEQKENTDLSDEEIFNELNIKKTNRDTVMNNINVISKIIEDYDFAR